MFHVKHRQSCLPAWFCALPPRLGAELFRRVACSHRLGGFAAGCITTEIDRPDTNPDHQEQEGNPADSIGFPEDISPIGLVGHFGGHGIVGHGIVRHGRTSRVLCDRPKFWEFGPQYEMTGCHGDPLPQANSLILPLIFRYRSRGKSRPEHPPHRPGR